MEKSKFKVGDLVTYSETNMKSYRLNVQPLGMIVEVFSDSIFLNRDTIAYRVFWISNHAYAGRVFGGFIAGDLERTG